jgi:transposase-like protein
MSWFGEMVETVKENDRVRQENCPHTKAYRKAGVFSDDRWICSDCGAEVPYYQEPAETENSEAGSSWW